MSSPTLRLTAYGRQPGTVAHAILPHLRLTHCRMISLRNLTAVWPHSSQKAVSLFPSIVSMPDRTRLSSGCGVLAPEQRQRAYTRTSCGLWNHRTAHRGRGPQGNQSSPIHDPTSSTLHLPHSARIKPQGYWEPRSELNCLVHAYNMLR
jgi:hypothetical protein